MQLRANRTAGARQPRGTAEEDSQHRTAWDTPRHNPTKVRRRRVQAWTPHAAGSMGQAAAEDLRHHPPDALTSVDGEPAGGDTDGSSCVAITQRSMCLRQHPYSAWRPHGPARQRPMSDEYRPDRHQRLRRDRLAQVRRPTGALHHDPQLRRQVGGKHQGRPRPRPRTMWMHGEGPGRPKAVWMQAPPTSATGRPEPPLVAVFCNDSQTPGSSRSSLRRSGQKTTAGRCSGRLSGHKLVSSAVQRREPNRQQGHGIGGGGQPAPYCVGHPRAQPDKGPSATSTGLDASCCWEHGASSSGGPEAPSTRRTHIR